MNHSLGVVNTMDSLVEEFMVVVVVAVVAVVVVVVVVFVGIVLESGVHTALHGEP